ncbi:primosomal protein N' [Leptolyngbya sp. PCC 6406]|uniref:primosomal protein N' n=1 Tax=Leptolyngbya sp. PCC 6406 TaxID=1173264 RepID=UPI0002ACAC55|nr:primosomal protein N' [Leptolyngbya sp. PCC 6406]
MYGGRKITTAETTITTETAPRWIEVLVDCPGVQGLYTYGVPPDLSIAAGDILSVPFGHQQVGAIAIRTVAEVSADLAHREVKAVGAVISPGVFSPTYWQLLETVADYYQTPLMQVIRTALPPGLLARSQRRVRLTGTVSVADLENPLAEARENLPPAALAVLTQLQRSPSGDYTWQYLCQQIPGAARGIHHLTQRGWVESYLALPQPPRPKRRQAVTVVAGMSGIEDLTPRQQEVLRLLQRRGGDFWLQEALQYCRTTSATLRSLAAKGYLNLEEREVLRQPQQPDLASDRPKALTKHQQTALAGLSQLGGGEVALLHGVTGSGKTEVYLQAIAPRLVAGQSALVLVPEIGLTPQLTDRFRQRFGERVCVYHSGLSEGERYDAWRQMLSGDPQVVIGTRSAVFAPLPCLGMVILDEEHDSSFKQDQPAPCYHARTVAYWRAKLDACPLVLGSATPSLESWVAVQPSEMGMPRGENKGREDDVHRGTAPEWVGSAHPTIPAMGGEKGTVGGAHPTGGEKGMEMVGTAHPTDLHYLCLPERIHARPMPPITVVDMRQELQAGNRSIFSRTLRRALETLEGSGEQGILFIHRRGHSSFVSCRACGHVMMCPHCDVSLSHHLPYADGTSTLRCHYCGYGQSQPPLCPACGSPYLKHFGSGTQRVEQALQAEFPGLRPLRFDSDTTRTKGSHRALLTRFAQGEADLLVGTQMLTKGIDLPQVTLVGIVAADGLLYMADYRASERAFQVLTQVAGRAGRGEQPGQVILQTYTPEHPVIGAVQRQSVTAFIETELAQRRALSYPPLGRLVLLRITSPDPVLVEKTADQLAALLRPQLSPEWSLLGPAPAPILRVARRYRWHLLLKGAMAPKGRSSPLGAATSMTIAAPLPDLTGLGQHCPTSVSLTIDIDPLNLG